MRTVASGSAAEDGGCANKFTSELCRGRLGRNANVGSVVPLEMMKCTLENRTSHRHEKRNASGRIAQLILNGLASATERIDGARRLCEPGAIGVSSDLGLFAAAGRIWLVPPQVLHD